jgi:hypothetical protein
MIISNSVDASLCYPYQAISYIVLNFFIMRRTQWNGKWPFSSNDEEETTYYYITSDILTLSRSGLCYLLTSNSC